MEPLLVALGALRTIVRALALGSLGVAALAIVLEQAVRTRRLNPFGRLGRLERRWIEPRLRPVESRLVRAGANPAHAPWLLLLTVGVAALLLILVTDTLARMAAQATFAGTAGPRAMLVLALSWTFGLLRLALLVRVVSSWIRLSPWSRWVRWSFVLTEWIIRPLQRVLPNIGIIDISPIVAYFGLALLEAVVVRLVAG